MDHRIEKLAEMMVNYSCGIRPGEHVMIRYGGDETFPLVTSLVRHIYAAGACPYLVRRDRRLEREIILGANDEQLELMCKHELAFYEDMDCFISVYAEHNAHEFSDIPLDHMQNYSKRYSMPTTFRRMQIDRWAGLNYPCGAEA